MAVEPRDAARLLVDRGPGVAPEHRRVADLVAHCEPGDVVVVNDTRVLPARLELRRRTGARVEVLLLEPTPGAPRGWEALARPSGRLAAGERLLGLGGAGVALVEALGEGRWRVELGGDVPVDELVASHGVVPLPPYLHGPLDDPERYQTVYARRAASAAAPTAGLHLTAGLIESLRAGGVPVVAVELVVGLGTFRPVTAERIDDHVMHEEAYVVPPDVREAVAAARRVLAVGTTTVRALESWAATGRPEGRTALYIRPGHRFAVVDRLLTNFHVPRSSLLVMIEAFVGPRWRDLYEEALRTSYRFLSLGDAMLLERARS